MKLCWFDW